MNRMPKFECTNPDFKSVVDIEEIQKLVEKKSIAGVRNDWEFVVARWYLNYFLFDREILPPTAKQAEEEHRDHEAWKFMNNLLDENNTLLEDFISRTAKKEVLLLGRIPKIHLVINLIHPFNANDFSKKNDERLMISKLMS